MSWWQVAARQGGVITGAQLRVAGRGPDAVAAATARGELQRLARGVYLVGGAPPGRSARLWAAVLATGGGLCLETAGMLWGVVPSVERTAVDVAVPHTRRPRPPQWIVVHRYVAMPPLVRMPSGLIATSRAETVLDLVARWPRARATTLLDRALQRRWITSDLVRRRLSRTPRAPGNAQLRMLLALTGDGAAAQSERLLHRLLRRGGVTGWVANHEVCSGRTVIAVVDVALPRRRVAIEVDGMAYHVDVERFRNDRRRQNALVAHGWTVLRFTWADLTERPAYVLATIRPFAA